MNVLEELKAELDGVVSRLDEALASKALKEQKKEPFAPTHGEMYYTSTMPKEYNHVPWTGEYLDTYRVSVGAVFATEEKAEKDAQQKQAQIRVLNKLRELEGDFVADFDDDTQFKNFIDINLNGGEGGVDSTTDHQLLPIGLYSTEMACQYIVNNMLDDYKLMIGEI